MKDPLKIYWRIFMATLSIGVIAFMVNYGFEPSYILGLFLYLWGINTLLNYFLLFIRKRRTASTTEPKNSQKEDQDTLTK